MVLETLSTSPNERGHFLKVAMDLYLSSISRLEDGQRTISFAIAALEAIYLKDNEHYRRNKILNSRLPEFMEFLGMDGEKVVADVDAGYKNVKNYYFHGSRAELRADELERLSLSLIQVARLSISTFLQMSVIFQKEELLDAIDRKQMTSTQFSDIRQSVIV